MALEKPLYMQPASGDAAIPYSGQQVRAGLLSSIFSREGVLDKLAGQLLVTQRGSGANMSVDVAPGRCAIFGDDISDQGAYICNNTSTVNVTVPARPSSGSRTHRVVARVRDKLSNGVWSGYDWTIELLADTGSGTPSQPNSAITLATVVVTSSTTSVTNSSITDQRPAATVGTPATAGSFALYSGFNPEDGFRPLRWSVNTDGWVFLSGFVRWTDVNASYPAGLTSMGGTPFANPLVRPAGFRDFPGVSSNGPVSYTVNNSGILSFRYQTTVTLTQNVSWFSFDGCFYRL